MLSSIGIKPDGIVGHSLGEVGCGYADGCLTAEGAVLAAYWSSDFSFDYLSYHNELAYKPPFN